MHAKGMAIMQWFINIVRGKAEIITSKTEKCFLFLTLYCVISQLPSGVQVKTKHGQVYPDIEISDGNDPGIEDDLPSVMSQCEQVRFDESLSGDNEHSVK